MNYESVAGAIEIYDGAIPNHEEVLAQIVAAAKWEDAVIGFDGTRNTSVRDNDVHWIHPFDFTTPTILFEFVKRVWHFVDAYGKRFDRPFGGMESVNVNRYLPGQQYHAHADANGQSTRVISALVYLNDDFTGGETEFIHFGEKVQPKAGRLVIFPSNYAYAHAALPPTQGIKYSAAFWMHS